MTEEELSRAAMTERYPESGMPYDWLAWYKLRDVYREYKTGRITKAEGEAQKESIFRARKEEIDKTESSKKAALRLGKFWIAIEEAGKNYMKEPNIDNADLFVKAVYGAGRLDRKE